jgi:hypothetical protein
MTILLLATITLATLTAYAWWQTRTTGSEASLSWCCPHCDKGLRYPPSRAGRSVPCPACKRRLTLPSAFAVADGAGSAARRYSLKRRGDAGLVLRPAR